MGYSFLSAIYFMVLLFTSLAIGFTLAGLRFQGHAGKLAAMSILAVGSAVLIQPVPLLDYLVVPLYLAVLLAFCIFSKVPFLQAVLAVLLAVTYHLMFVQLFEQNLLGLLLEKSGTSQDAIIQTMNALFIAMNNIWISLVIHQKKPLLFPSELFQRDHHANDFSSFRLHLYFSMLIFASLDVFLFCTYMERYAFTAAYRVFASVWSMLICALILYFLKKTFVHKLEREQIYMDQQYQSDLHAFFNLVRSQRHDFNLHLTSVYGLIQSGKYQAANTYIEDIVLKAQQVNELLPLAHPAASALLYAQSELAAQKGIDMHYQIRDDLRDMPCSVYHMNTILGNLIQNAIEETERQSGDRVIEVEIYREYQQIAIKVTNPALVDDQQMEQMFIPGYSTKASHEGIGLSGIEKMIAGYEGIIYPVASEGRLSMHVRIPLTLKQSI